MYMYKHPFTLFPHQSCEREYKKKIETGTLTDDLKFQYSWYLIKSRYKNDVKKGIKLMAGLLIITN